MGAKKETCHPGIFRSVWVLISRNIFRKISGPLKGWTSLRSANYKKKENEENLVSNIARANTYEIPASAGMTEKWFIWPGLLRPPGEPLFSLHSNSPSTSQWQSSSSLFFHPSSLFGFTLVELIVVITILAILWTVSFLSFNGYSSNSRDSVRIADLANISKTLEIGFARNSSYPTPDNLFTITYSGWVVWYQGTVGSGMINRTAAGMGSAGLSKKPTDPLRNTEYTYSVLKYGSAYSLKTDYEGDSVAYAGVLNQANAAPGNPLIAYIRGNYGGVVAKTQTGSTSSTTIYVLAIPSIISSTGSTGQTIEISANVLSGMLLLHGKSNTTGISFNPNAVVFSGTSLPKDDTGSGISNMMSALKSTYSASPDTTNLTALQSIITASTGSYANIGSNIITGNLGGTANASPTITVMSNNPTTLSLSPSTAQSNMNVTSPSTTGSYVTFTLTNTGDITSNTISTSLLSTTNFEFGTNTCSGATLAGNTSCSLQVRPKASNNWTLSSTLRVTHSGSNIDVGLSGNASGFCVNTTGGWTETLPANYCNQSAVKNKNKWVNYTNQTDSMNVNGNTGYQAAILVCENAYHALDNKWHAWSYTTANGTAMSRYSINDPLYIVGDGNLIDNYSTAISSYSVTAWWFPSNNGNQTLGISSVYCLTAGYDY